MVGWRMGEWSREIRGEERRVIERRERKIISYM
jgi:hypothetical protein